MATLVVPSTAHAEPDGLAPDCTITTPAPGVVSGIVTIAATTSSTANSVLIHVDGELLGHAFTSDVMPGTEFSYAAYGTADQGWASMAEANGIHRLQCQALAAEGVGELSRKSVPVNVRNDVHVDLVSPGDDSDVRGDVPLVVELTAHKRHPLPSSVMFTMDDADLIAAACEPVHAAEPNRSVQCAAVWDTVATTADRSWDAAQGLRVHRRPRADRCGGAGSRFGPYVC